MQVGQTITVPLHVNASGSYVQAADIELEFDSDFILASQCRAGADANNLQGFECRYNIFGNLDSMQISYVDSGVSGERSASAAADTALFELALITFQV